MMIDFFNKPLKVGQHVCFPVDRSYLREGVITKLSKHNVWVKFIGSDNTGLRLVFKDEFQFRYNEQRFIIINESFTE